MTADRDVLVELLKDAQAVIRGTYRNGEYGALLSRIASALATPPIDLTDLSGHDDLEHLDGMLEDRARE